MIIWLSLLIPIIACIFCSIKYKKEFVWWELLVPIAGCLLFTTIMKYSVETYQVSDTQYKNGVIVEARYYESWSTWVSKMCTERYACGSHTEGSGKNARTVTDYCTRYYDCSYCDDHNPYWEVYDNLGHSWSISQEKYNSLMKQWGVTPQFVNLHRSIDYHSSLLGSDCGKDGNMYSIKWDGNRKTAETSVVEATYTNKIQASKSNFDLQSISEDQAKKYGLYEYPKIYNSYRQKVVLGLDSCFNMNGKDTLEQQMEYLNGFYGPKRKCKIFVCLFNNKDLSIALKQRSYWDGGNKNEIVICVDVDKNNGKLNWVYVFSWTANKRIAVDLREDIMNLGYLDVNKFIGIVEKDTKEFVYRDFREFNYLTTDPPTWEVWLVFLFTFGITIFTLWWSYNNEYEN